VARSLGVPAFAIRYQEQPRATRRRGHAVEDRIEALRVQIEQMEAAMASRPGLPAQITPGKAPGEAGRDVGVDKGPP
jgi:hypothetical protein